MANKRVWTALAFASAVVGLVLLIIALAQPCRPGRDLAIGQALVVAGCDQR
ncbi:hypothetical protein [Bradyrhizobium guangdongense]|uniref:hypothetical protein n=1 Tax=Bradyrhizobium guangdongense TaxID=1325090 RepID=UPI0013E8E35C|nr:hypothetical protein [Bradyrhizobium guangdongense]